MYIGVVISSQPDLEFAIDDEWCFRLVVICPPKHVSNHKYILDKSILNNKLVESFCDTKELLILFKFPVTQICRLGAGCVTKIYILCCRYPAWYQQLTGLQRKIRESPTLCDTYDTVGYVCFTIYTTKTRIQTGSTTVPADEDKDESRRNARLTTTDKKASA